MSQPGLEMFDSTLQKTHAWLHELEDIAHLPDEATALKGLRAVLHTLRNSLPVNEAAHFGAQLPVLIRGIFYEGWHPAGMPERVHSRDEFLGKVHRMIIAPGTVDSLRVTQGVFELLNHHLSPGEPEKLRAVLPTAVRELWPEPSPLYR